jgi:methyltransferase
VIAGLESRVAFSLLIAAVALQRLWELALSRRHLRALLARGAREVGASHYPWMVALHTAFLVACLAEVWLLGRPFRLPLALGALAVLAVAVALRLWTLASLGERWTTRVLVLPGEPLVTAGPYRWLRHPNYLVVVLELAAIPLVHGAWLTAVVFGLGNLALLRLRIGVEEAALAAAEGGR